MGKAREYKPSAAGEMLQVGSAQEGKQPCGPEHCSVVIRTRPKPVRSRPGNVSGKALGLGKHRARGPNSPPGVGVAARMEVAALKKHEAKVLVDMRRQVA